MNLSSLKLPQAAATSRRSFLKRTATVSALAAFPFIRTSARGAGPNEKVNLALCGIGNRGGDISMALAGTGLCNIVALCDTDMGAPHTKNILNRYPSVPKFQDFRQMLDKMGNQIDAVSIGVPDHTHFPIAMMAMGLGKHIYVEKPMGHTYHEIALMMQSEKKNKVAAQMGNQGHSSPNYYQFKAWVDAGIIKNVTRIVAHMNGGRRWHKWNGQVASLPPAQPIPETLDWDTWLGQVAFHEYNKDYINGDWRCWYDFGNGALGDWGAHIMDTAHEFLHLGLPTEIDVLKMSGHNPFVFPMESTLAFRFPARGSEPPCVIEWYEGVKNLPQVPVGFNDSKTAAADIPPPGGGSVTVNNLAPGKEIYSESLIFKGGSHNSTLEIIPQAKAKEMAGKLPKVPGGQSDHFRNFMLACKGEETCRSNFAVAGPLCQMMALGVVAQRLNAKLEFDPKAQKITNNKAADALLVGPPPRKGWEQYYKV